MPQGIRPGATILSGPVRPNGTYTYDATTRRTVQVIQRIVPELNIGDTAVAARTLSSIFYVNLGHATASTDLPLWFGQTATSVTLNTWDATEKKYYARLSSAAGAAVLGGGHRFAHYGGFAGTSTTHAPKNLQNTTTMRLRFRARFPDGVSTVFDYGIGLSNVTGTTAFASSGTNQWVYLATDGTNWRLETRDGTTASSGDSGTADTSWHDFDIRWSSGSMVLYVDSVSTITKTTNLPTEPLRPVITAQDNTKRVDIFDYRIDWQE